MKTITAIVLSLASIATCVACPTFREPAVNFAGITTQVELEKYLWDEFAASSSRLSKEHESVLQCIQQERIKTGRYDQLRAEAEQYQADVDRFRAQVKQAGKAHLALIAAQPFKGAYTGAGMASTGGAGRLSSSSTESSSRSASTAASSGSGKTYTPWQHCIRVERAYETTPQKIMNLCDQPIEAHWQDTGGGWNQVTIPVRDEYLGGYKSQGAWACAANDSFDRKLSVCKD